MAFRLGKHTHSCLDVFRRDIKVKNGPEEYCSHNAVWLNVNTFQCFTFWQTLKKPMAYLSSIKLWCLSNLHIHINDETLKEVGGWSRLMRKGLFYELWLTLTLFFPLRLTVAHLPISWFRVMLGECKSPVMYHVSAKDCLYCNIFKSTGSDCILIYDVIFWCVNVCVNSGCDSHAHCVSRLERRV